MIILTVILISFSFGTDLDRWIKKKSSHIISNNYKVSFDYSLKNKIENKIDPELRHVDFFSFGVDSISQVLKVNNRFVIFHEDYTEIIDQDSMQRFYDKKDNEFENIKNKILSIFRNQNYKIIKLSKKKYFLSLNDYYLNIEISFNNNEDKIDDISFTEDSQLFNIKKFHVSAIDSIPYNDSEWESYQMIDLR